MEMVANLVPAALYREFGKDLWFPKSLTHNHYV